MKNNRSNYEKFRERLNKSVPKSKLNLINTDLEKLDSEEIKILLEELGSASNSFENIVKTVDKKVSCDLYFTRILDEEE